MPSIESNALEPTRGELAGLSPAQKIVRLLPVYGLLILTVLLILLFSLLLPNTFPTLLNFRSILSRQGDHRAAVAGRDDPDDGRPDRPDRRLRHRAVAHPGDQPADQFGVPWPVAVLIVLLLGAAIGCAQRPPGRGRADRHLHRHARHRHDALRARALAHRRPADRRRCCRTASMRSTAPSSSACRSPAFYVLAIASSLWIILEYTADRPLPLRHRRQPARGRAERHPDAHATSSAPSSPRALLTALAGVLLAAKLRIGQASVGLEFLLPALVGAFLGSTTIKPGRVNVWGTIVGVIILAVGISGIQQFGGSFFVEPLFNGVTLLIAIGIAGYAQRKRGKAAPETDLRKLNTDSHLQREEPPCMRTILIILH